MNCVRGRKAALLACIVLALGVSVSLWAALALRAAEARSAELAMDRRTQTARQAVSGEARRYVDMLHLVSAAMSSYESPDAERFRTATAPVAAANLIGASMILFVVPQQDRNGHEHFVVVMARALNSPEQPVPGPDLGASAAQSAPMVESRRTGRVAVSDTFPVVSQAPNTARQLAFDIVDPVYGLPDARGQRPFRGWLLIRMPAQDFIVGVLRAGTEQVLGASLWARDSDGRQVRVATVPAAGHPDMSRETTMTVAGRMWTLRTTASSSVLIGHNRILPLALGLGIGVPTLLLAGLVWVLATRRVRAEERAEEATRGLRAAEAEARQQTTLLSTILDTLTEGVEVVDASGGYLLQNPAAARILGTGPADGGPQTWQRHYGYFGPDGSVPVSTVDLPMVRAMRGHATDAVELTVRNPAQAERIISVSGRPLTGAPKDAVAMTIFHDITAIRARETELRAFAGVVAHDLKAPLANIAGFADLALDEISTALPGTAGDQARHDLHRIGAAVVRAGHLIDDLLAYTTAREAPLHLHAIDLTALVAEVVAAHTDHLRPEAPQPDIYLNNLGYVAADPAMIRRVLDNLIGNAIKYVPPGQRARITVTAWPDARPGWTRLEVADRGIGIPDSDKGRVFDPFYRARSHDRYAGTGLGLAICQRVVERHGGTITATDNPGGGTRFELTLPSSAPPRPEPATGTGAVVALGTPQRPRATTTGGFS